MNDPAPFRLSLRQARALKRGVAVCALLAVALFVAGAAYPLASGDARQISDTSRDGAMLLAMLALGLFVRRGLGLAHRRQMTALAWLTDPHAPDHGEPDAEIPSPRPSVDPDDSTLPRK